MGTGQRFQDPLGYLSGEPECLDGPDGCSGTVEFRMALSATGRSFPRCARHWDERLVEQDRINRTYPSQPPSDWSPLDAGEHWDEDY